MGIRSPLSRGKCLTSAHLALQNQDLLCPAPPGAWRGQKLLDIHIRPNLADQNLKRAEPTGPFVRVASTPALLPGPKLPEGWSAPAQPSPTPRLADGKSFQPSTPAFPEMLSTVQEELTMPWGALTFSGMCREFKQTAAASQSAQERALSERSQEWVLTVDWGG